MNLFHKHKWLIRYNLPGGFMVATCQKCPASKSHMFNYSRNKWEWIDGNFITDSMRPVYVLAGNYEEFLEAKSILIEKWQNGLYDIKFVQGWETFNHSDTMPTVIFYGTWYTNGILEDPRLTEILNHRR